MAFFEKWNPSRELERFRDEFDGLLEKFGFGQGLADLQNIPQRPAMETTIEGDKFTVRVDLPGIDPKNVDVKVVGGVLTIKGSREEKHETKKPDYFRREIRYGAFERSISLPQGMKAEDLKAAYHDGVLELTAPMPKEAIAKEVKVQIETAPAKKAIDEKRAA